MESKARSAAAWIRPEQAALVRAIADRAGLLISTVGTSASGRAGELAQALDAAPSTDLRNLLASTDVSCVLLLAADGLGEPRTSDDAEVIRAATERGVEVLTLEPLPASVLELADLLGHEAAYTESLSGSATGAASGGATLAGCRFMPLTRAARTLRDATEMLAEFGPVRAATVEMLGAPVHGSLGARLFDALDLALHLLGEPETVDASISSVLPRSGSPARESLRGLDGHLGANLRYADGRACTILASNQASSWEGRLTLLGEKGCVRLTHEGFEWRGTHGAVVDKSRRRPARRPRRGGVEAAATGTLRAAASGETDPAGDQHGAFVEAVAEQIGARHVSLFPPVFPSAELSRVLAIGQAAMLSARTGVGESPATFRRMVER
ncbi:MAG: hypothetical protein AB7K52_03830 [Phycisphaerales bacterium]